MLTGTDLLTKVKDLGDVSKSDLVKACGYVSEKKDGGERTIIARLDETGADPGHAECALAATDGLERELQIKIGQSGKHVPFKAVFADWGIAEIDEETGLRMQAKIGVNFWGKITNDAA